jgi:AraC-like DNA-binding protein
MKTQLFKTVFFVTALFCIHCSDNETPQDQLPPITQTDANTFGAVINGEIFIPKDKTGYTPPGGGTPKGLEVYYKNNNNFINEHRINLSKNLLRNQAYQQYTITSIGLESGFNSKSAFYHTFKKQTGVTPSAYQKR